MDSNLESLHKVTDCTKKLCFGLQSDDKMSRKQAIVQFENFLNSKHNLTEVEFHEIFKEIHIHLLNTLRDKSEAVRERSIKCLKLFILEILPRNDYYLSYLFPIFVERIGSVEVIEESEELRLQLVKFLIDIIDYYFEENYLKAFLNDFVLILKETVQDKFSEIKETSCLCIIKLANAIPRDFHQQSENLVKPVLTAFGHQRYKVRMEAIKAMGDIVLHSSYKALEEVAGPMAERLFDPIPKVRQTVQQVASRWLLEYRDRYSFFYKLLPLILTGLNDEIEETRQHAHILWLQVGLQYQQENVKELKDQLDFLTEAPKNYPEKFTRPNLGCRVLVQRNVGKLVPPLSRELTSWQTDVRIRCSQLLCAIALHGEQGITQHLQDILMAMYSAAKDEESAVVANVKIIQASEIMALFVPVDTWQKLILPILDDCPHYGHLAILGAFIRGTTQENIGSSILEICRLLADKNICYSRKHKYQKELINCALALQAHYDNSTPEVANCLFRIYVTVLSIKDKDLLFDFGLLDGLCNKLGDMSVNELWSTHLESLLLTVCADPKSWTVTTIERCVFETILFNCGESFGENLPLIGDILISALDPDADAEARLQTFVALSFAFENKDVIFKKTVDLNVFLERMVCDILVPSLVWHAGRTSETMRTIAASCLHCALNPGVDVNIFANQENLRSIFNQLLPLLLSLTEDSSYKSRFLAMEDLALIKGEMVKKNQWSDDDLLKIYPEIVKRLDDPTDQVRVCAVKTLGLILKDVPSEFKKDNYKAHHELLLDTLLTHFDDDDEDFQQLVLDVLKVLATICKETAECKVKKHKPLIRNQIGCDEVLEYLKTLQLV